MADFVSPTTILAQLPLTPGMTVADLGAGNGALAIPLARTVGGQGRVYAVEIQRTLVESLAAHIGKTGLPVQVLWGDLERLGGTKIPDKSCDMVLAINVFFMLEDKAACINEISRILKPSGKVVVVDWTDGGNGVGPHPEMVITKQSLLQLFTNAGFAPEREFEAGSHHYGVMVGRSAAS